MSDEFKAVTTEEAQAGLAALGTQEIEGETRYEFANRQPPSGYVTLRDTYRVCESHPSWLRTLVSKGGLTKFDEDGAPAVIKNIRGVWALRIDALQKYEETKRQPGEGTGKGAGYHYEPQVLKVAKRMATAVVEYAAILDNAEQTKADVDKLVEHLKAEWEAGKIGKSASESDEDEDAGETKAEPAGAADNDEDFEFDFSDVD